MPDYGYSRPNTQMMQYGMQMMQPRYPGQAAPMPPVFQQQTDQPQDEVPSPTGKRRIRIGNRTYVEEDPSTGSGQAAAPPAQIGNRSY